MVHTPTVLEISADRALFENKIQGLVVTCYQNERPLSGLVGLLDWRLQGRISECLRMGALSGEAGECAYLPITRNNKTYHLILVGCGYNSASHGQRSELPPPESLNALKKNLQTLRLAQVGISKSDFGNPNPEFFSKNMKGVSLWIAP